VVHIPRSDGQLVDLWFTTHCRRHINISLSGGGALFVISASTLAALYVGLLRRSVRTSLVVHSTSSVRLKKAPRCWGLFVVRMDSAA